MFVRKKNEMILGLMWHFVVTIKKTLNPHKMIVRELLLKWSVEEIDSNHWEMRIYILTDRVKKYETLFSTTNKAHNKEKKHEIPHRNGSERAASEVVGGGDQSVEVNTLNNHVKTHPKPFDHALLPMLTYHILKVNIKQICSAILATTSHECEGGKNAI